MRESAPLELIAAHPWRRAVFTTYALSLSFFEAVVLDALVRGGGRGALILADVEGVRAALGEQGARRAGRDYDIEPVAARTGVFHPKVTALTSTEDCHLLVGSGNLTFGGWGGNLEVVEHLHAGFAADGLADAADFFDDLASTPRTRHEGAEVCSAVAEELRAAVRGRVRTGAVRLLHSLDGAIGDKLVGAASELGGAVRLVAAAPFWDAGSAIDRLSAALSLNTVHVHAHSGGTVGGAAGINWPRRTSTRIEPILLDALDQASARPLHAKVFEIVCRRGRLVLSGSANGTAAALWDRGNVEACVLRVQREPTTGWSFSPAEPPEPVGSLPEEDEASELPLGVLRAVLEADEIRGSVLSPALTGPATCHQVTAEGLRRLSDVSIDVGGRFRLNAPGLEVESWQGGRLVLRLQAQGGAAEGFVSVAAFAEITRRAGVMGSRLMALMAGTEAPADALAIMAWVHEDPTRLLRNSAPPVGPGFHGRAEDAGNIPVSELRPATSRVAIGTPTAGAGWARFIDHLFSALRAPRPSFGTALTGRPADDEADDEPDVSGAIPVQEVDPAISRALAVFEHLFDRLLAPEHQGRHWAAAFSLAEYVCARLAPEPVQARSWLERLLSTVPEDELDEHRNDLVAAALLLGGDHAGAGVVNARAYLIRLGVDLSAEGPPAAQLAGFATVLASPLDQQEVWRRVRLLRTRGEQARVYLHALESGSPCDGYSDLLRSEDERSVLEAAFTERGRKSILASPRRTSVCPRCSVLLPSSEAYKLRTYGVATAGSCCGRVIVCTEI